MTTMQIDRATVEQALEALKYLHEEKCNYMRRNNLGDPLRENAARLALPAITTLRAALAQQAEPLNLADPAVQKRLATQWGYVPAAQAEPGEQLAELQAMLRAEVDRLIAAGIQPQRKPLTEGEIESCRQQGYAHAGFSAPFDFGKAARAVERAHGIKE